MQNTTFDIKVENFICAPFECCKALNYQANVLSLDPNLVSDELLIGPLLKGTNFVFTVNTTKIGQFVFEIKGNHSGRIEISNNITVKVIPPPEPIQKIIDILT